MQEQDLARVVSQPSAAHGDLPRRSTVLSEQVYQPMTSELVKKLRELVFKWAGDPGHKEPLTPKDINDTFKCLQAAADYLDQLAAATDELMDETLREQRDELLAALKQINALPSELAGDAWAIARAAIAKATTGDKRADASG